MRTSGQVCIGAGLFHGHMAKVVSIAVYYVLFRVQNQYGGELGVLATLSIPRLWGALAILGILED